MNTIYLIRHGKTEANEQHLYCGSTDLALSDAGREELRQMKYGINAEEFIISGMRRTEETLRILFGEVPFSVCPDFREIDFGIFEMKGYEQLKEDPDYQAWITGDNDANIPPLGESGVQMRRRVLPAFRSLQQKDRSIAVITHGGVIACIMETLFPEEEKSRYQWQPKPGHGYALYGDCYRFIP